MKQVLLLVILAVQQAVVIAQTCDEQALQKPGK